MFSFLSTGRKYLPYITDNRIMVFLFCLRKNLEGILEILYSNYFIIGKKPDSEKLSDLPKDLY